ncbi:helix-turn-helix domain-containing protein [Gryllotalpicola sp.]|uniref:helix-turn-helix domain-containing protein n=1 Tax=Gryllotalpicola sp. TaxID=1932787 RepID=UPI0026115E8A|nr:helix-turn-helix domain-containing protein [Gryllotalpicola sp.]
MSKLAYTLDEAAIASGISKRTIREHIDAGRLVASYPSSRPVILASELERWLESLPHEPKKVAA